ncbi:MAG: methionine aminotransferase [Herpetosiphon sp.]
MFTTFAALAVEHQAVNLGQGFPDFAGPELLKNRAIEAIRADHNQYAPSNGLPALRQAIADTYATSYGLVFDPEHEITVTSGATEALCAIALALIDPGDEVIVFEPAYDAYVPDVLMAGGVPRPVQLYPPADGKDWHWHEDELVTAFNHRTRAIIINNPHNPTGKVFGADELARIAELCQTYDVLAVTDEVYDRLVFVGRHLPLATLPGMRERTITVNSTGKTFSVTGWKIGYVMAVAALTEAIRRSHQFLTFATATPLQWGMTTALTDALTSRYYDELQQFYGQNRELLVRSLRAAGLDVFEPAGSYFVLSKLPAGWSDDVAFCRYLTTEVGVAAIPASVFYVDPQRASHLARFCFAKQPATLRAAAERLARMQVTEPAVDRPR